jgi:farnesyl diphosphate synthase
MTDPDAAFEAGLADAQRAIEARLADLLAAPSGVPQRLTTAMRHAVLGGGKRFRPFLVMESAKLFAGGDVAALEVAAALECVHCYSLVHDDLPSMDNDRLRRGQPTVWAAYDEWTAVLTGDALTTLAFELLAGAPATAEVRVRLVRELAEAAGPAGMVGGQVIDLEADKLGHPPAPSLEHIRHLQALKTGALIRFACRAGPILAGRPAADVEALSRYGEALGLAFQISDDLLDATGDAATVGKAVGKDAAAGKATLVSLMGLAEARQALDDVGAAASTALAPYGTAAAALIGAARYMTRRRS